jgi:antitoxin (DNA-binding transcriptional repressor) of toxin-antitoxin stability system
MTDMPIVTMRDLSRHASTVVAGLRRAKTDIIVTYRGRAVARLVPMTDEESEADERAGRLTPLSEVMKDGHRERPWSPFV